jgi:nicotinamidase-related amidase
MDTIIEEWSDVHTPPPPELERLAVDAGTTALLVLDIQKQNCNAERRPRCVATLPGIRKLLAAARDRGMCVAHSLTSRASQAELREEVAPREGEPVVRSGVDKFYGTELEEILRARGTETVILVGTSAHGAVLHTAAGAAMRGFRVIVPVDGMSASDAYAEQYTAWHLASSPGTSRQTTLTRIDWLEF